MRIAINYRMFAPKRSASWGVCRYLKNVLDNMTESGISYSFLHPKKGLNVIEGHLWEQFVLPRCLKGELLWSPSYSGPIRYSNQVVTVHDIQMVDCPELNVNDRKGYSLLKSQWFKFMYRRFLPQVRAIIAVSEFTKQRIVEMFDVSAEKIHVIYEATGENFKPTASEVIDIVRKKYDISWGRYVLVLDSLDPKGNFRRLIQAWQQLSMSSKDDTGLVIVGSRDPRISLKILGVEDCPPNVMFTGFIEDADLPAIYSGASAFVFPSLYEGFGLPPLEAMACEVPVVVSNVTSLPEVCGGAAVYVDPLSVESIAEGIRSVLENETLANDLCQKGAAQAAKFSWGKCNREHVELFKQIM